MVQVLSRENRPSFSSQFAQQLGQGVGSGIGQGIEQIIKSSQARKENEALKRLTGEDFSGILDQDLKYSLINSLIKRQQSAQGEQNELTPYKEGLATLDRMEELLSKGAGTKLGLKYNLGSFAGQKKREARGEFEALGTSLIPLISKGVRITSQREFDKYAKIISNPYSSTSDIKGAIKGIRRSFEEKLGASDYDDESEIKRNSSKKVKFNPKNPEHMAKFRQLDKKFKGDRKKVNEKLALEFDS